MEIYNVDPYVRFCAYQKYFNNIMFCGESYFMAYDSRMLYCISGSGKIEVDNKIYDMQKDSILIFKNGMKYRYIHNEKRDMECISANFDYDRRYQDKYANIILPVIPSEFDSKRLLNTPFLLSILYIKNAARLKSDVLQLYKRYYEIGINKEAETGARMKMIITGAYSLYQNELMKESTASSDLINKICDYIDHNAENISNSTDVAEIFSYHAYYLSNLLKNNLGYTLHNYIIKAKINKSVEYLLTTQMSIAEIADKCGFYDSAHFSKQFKKAIGYSPSKFRYM